ncbi:MAG: hypothetical protein QXS41_03045 [Candidatus Woesearchaeota archaeon]
MKNIEHLIAKKERELKIDDFMNLPDLKKKIQASCVENFFKMQKLLYEISSIEKEVYISNFSKDRRLCRDVSEYIETLNKLSALQTNTYLKIIKMFGKINYLSKEKEEVFDEEILNIYKKYPNFNSFIYNYEKKVLNNPDYSDLDTMLKFLEKEFDYKIAYDPTVENEVVLEVIFGKYYDNFKILNNVIYNIKECLHNEVKKLQKEYSKKYILDVPFELDALTYEEVFKKYDKVKQSWDYSSIEKLYEKILEFERQFDEILNENFKRYELFFKDPEYDKKHNEKQTKFGILREIKETISWYRFEKEYQKKRKQVIKKTKE